MKRDSILFYRSVMDALKELPPEVFKEAVLGMCTYGMDGEEPELSGMAKIVFLMAKPLIDSNNRKYQNGRKGGRPASEKPNDNQDITKEEPTDNHRLSKEKPNDNLYVKGDMLNAKGEMINNKKTEYGRFSPPTITQVQEYASEKGLDVNAERFVDFYASKGWMVGKNRMKDWKAAVRNWARSQRQELTAETAKKNRFNNFPQREYDYEQLEKELLDC